MVNLRGDTTNLLKLKDVTGVPIVYERNKKPKKYSFYIRMNFLPQ